MGVDRVWRGARFASVIQVAAFELLAGEAIQRSGPHQVPAGSAIFLGCLFFGLASAPAGDQQAQSQNKGKCKILRQLHEDSFLRWFVKTGNMKPEQTPLLHVSSFTSST